MTTKPKLLIGAAVIGLLLSPAQVNAQASDVQRVTGANDQDIVQGVGGMELYQEMCGPLTGDGPFWIVKFREAAHAHGSEFEAITGKMKESFRATVSQNKDKWCDMMDVKLSQLYSTLSPAKSQLQ